MLLPHKQRQQQRHIQQTTSFSYQKLAPILNLKIFMSTYNRLVSVQIDRNKVQTVLDLHDHVFDYIKRYVTPKENSLNNYILVKNNYLPIESINQLEEDDSLILVSKNQFTMMIDHIRYQNDRLKMTPTRRFAQQLRDQYTKDLRERQERERQLAEANYNASLKKHEYVDEEGRKQQDQQYSQNIFRDIEIAKQVIQDEKSKNADNQIDIFENLNFKQKAQPKQNTVQNILDDEDDEIMIIGDNASPTFQNYLSQQESQVSNSTVPNIQEELNKSNSQDARKITPQMRAQRRKQLIDDKIIENKNKVFKQLHSKISKAKLLGQQVEPELRLRYETLKRSLGINEPLINRAAFEDLRDNASSGQVSYTSCSNLVINNNLMKENSSIVSQKKLNQIELDKNLYFLEKTHESISLFQDEEVICDIPMEDSLQSLNRNVDKNYAPNERLDYDHLIIPKEENLIEIQTEKFFEFNRVFKCTRPELIYLLKGLAEERHFSLMVCGDNVSKCYRLINLKCTGSKYKKKERELYQDKCTFYLQYLEEPDQPNVFKLHSYNQTHKHFCQKRETINMSDYYSRKTSQTHDYKSYDRATRKDWRNEFMKSLTYELTTVYADQIVNSMQKKNPMVDKKLIQRIRGERGGEKIEEQIQQHQVAYGHEKSKACSTKQIVKELNIDKTLYFERYINIYGMDTKC
ncbi:hypothetical protein OXYTRIMIC_699 [Oxytricha trifallax]|uniref:Uncharacterized protein n=1 Tax=Oxytricha trifallax TaxID=1172189 RepID=A0A073HXQ6_9SPIT|nr:hypothetical protein OXYTRIMIC_699 [Oxytricha trifallax]